MIASFPWMEIFSVAAVSTMVTRICELQMRFTILESKRRTRSFIS